MASERKPKTWKRTSTILVEKQKDGSSMHCYESAKSLLIIAWSHGTPHSVATHYRVKKSLLRKLVHDRPSGARLKGRRG